MWRRILVLAIAFGAAACATKYQELGFSGGVAAEQLTTDVFRIKSRGNAYTAATTIQDYVLLKAAETTKSVGATHFVDISSADASRMGTITAPGSVNTSFVGNSAFTTYTPPSTTTYIKPGEDAFIRVIRVPTGQQPHQEHFPPTRLSSLLVRS